MRASLSHNATRVSSDGEAGHRVSQSANCSVSVLPSLVGRLPLSHCFQKHQKDVPGGKETPVCPELDSERRAYLPVRHLGGEYNAEVEARTAS